MKKIDMSSEAIARRLRQTDQLRKLSLALMKAKPISKSRAAELRARIRDENVGTNQPNT